MMLRTAITATAHLLAVGIWTAAGADARSDYLRYCASCHGAGADGAGAVADIAASPVPALTTIAARNGGVFPRQKVIEIIRGDAGLALHAQTGMPGWSDTFRYDGELGSSPYPQEIALQRRVQALADLIGRTQE